MLSEAPLFYLAPAAKDKPNRSGFGLVVSIAGTKKMQELKIIEIKFTKKFGGAWCAFEAPGVEPAFPGPTGKHYAILVGY